MSWTDIFPVLDDYALDSFLRDSSSEDRSYLEEMFGVESIFNAREGSHIVSASLFWKHALDSEGDLPMLSREALIDSEDLGLVNRFHPWKHYVLPLLEGAESLKRERPDVVMRVYLANDLKFLVQDLVQAGCEVFLMKSSSIRHNPGAMWRFLALEESDKLVTITDADRGSKLLEDIIRTEMLPRMDLGLWRIPYAANTQSEFSNPGNYRPIIACCFGARGGIPIRMLMDAFLWSNMNGRIKGVCKVGFGPQSLEFAIFGANWPNYGFDEWFLLAAFFPRIVGKGVLTLRRLGANHGGNWFGMDIEYVTWSNSRSELFIYN